ncbi:unnamed protein product [Coregonus sp. 'balchen']|nr:unnamed protein product [Coregonus sp. 'balchen']
MKLMTVWSLVLMVMSRHTGDTVKLSCKISGFSMSGYWIHWMRQKRGKALEWIGRMNSNSPFYTNSLKGQLP